MKIGLVLEGGAKRCIFTAGVLDCFLEHKVIFDYVVGVSAGAQAALDFIAEQKGRSKSIAMPQSKHSASLKSKLSCDLTEIIYQYPYDTYPFDFELFYRSFTECEIVTTDAQTGKAFYFSGNIPEKTLLDALCASCSLPLLYPMVKIEGREYLDGSISDAIPFERAFQKGCDKVVVISPKTAMETATDYRKYRPILQRKFEKDYPLLFQSLMNRLMHYQIQNQKMPKYVDCGKILLIQPDHSFVKPFEINRSKLEYAYQKGYEKGDCVLDCMSEFIEQSITIK